MPIFLIHVGHRSMHGMFLHKYEEKFSNTIKIFDCLVFFILEHFILRFVLSFKEH